MAKRLRRASPKTGERKSLHKISAELEKAGYLNKRGRPYNPNSIKLMLDRPLGFPFPSPSRPAVTMSFITTREPS
jgi:hypothetical protein